MVAPGVTNRDNVPAHPEPSAPGFGSGRVGKGWNLGTGTFLGGSAHSRPHPLDAREAPNGSLKSTAPASPSFYSQPSLPPSPSPSPLSSSRGALISGKPLPFSKPSGMLIKIHEAPFDHPGPFFPFHRRSEMQPSHSRETPHIPGKSCGIPALGEPQRMERGRGGSLEAQNPKSGGVLGSLARTRGGGAGTRGKTGKEEDENDPGEKKGKGWE